MLYLNHSTLNSKSLQHLENHTIAVLLVRVYCILYEIFIYVLPLDSLSDFSLEIWAKL